MAYNQTAADYYFIDQCQSMSFSLSDLHAPSALEIRKKFLGILYWLRFAYVFGSA